MSTWNDHHGDMADSYHDDKFRCYAYVMEDGLCIRTNSIPAYCEANRQVMYFERMDLLNKHIFSDSNIWFEVETRFRMVQP